MDYKIDTITVIDAFKEDCECPLCKIKADIRFFLLFPAQVGIRIGGCTEQSSPLSSIITISAQVKRI